jgi:WhiB family transcriptional regulator, redox-sensing transcriptional regulator
MTYDDAPNWEEAVCANVDPDLFFNSHYHSIHLAKKICETCPLIKMCADYALTHPEMAEYGVWGGMSERERAELRRKKPQSRKGISNKKVK